MKENFDFCFAAVVATEGGFVDHPSDPGGATNMGVTLSTYREWFGSEHTVEDLRKIKIEDVRYIFEMGYWNICDGDHLPAGVDLCVVDWAYNGGPGRAAKFLQRIVGAEADGRIGPQTLQETREYIELGSGFNTLIRNYMKARESYYRSRPHAGAFLRGWMNRIEEIEAKCKELYAGVKNPTHTGGLGNAALAVEEPVPVPPLGLSPAEREAARQEYLRVLIALAGNSSHDMSEGIMPVSLARRLVRESHQYAGGLVAEDLKGEAIE